MADKTFVVATREPGVIVNLVAQLNDFFEGTAAFSSHTSPHADPGTGAHAVTITARVLPRLGNGDRLYGSIPELVADLKDTPRLG